MLRYFYSSALKPSLVEAGDVLEWMVGIPKLLLSVVSPDSENYEVWLALMNRLWQCGIARENGPFKVIKYPH